jgi:ribosome-associated protein
MANDAPRNMRMVKISKEPTELCKILKFENLVGSGGEAKQAIADGAVLVNGEVETRKRRKIVSGDVIEFAGKVIRIIAG